jgi:hypothetical protein
MPVIFKKIWDLIKENWKSIIVSVASLIIAWQVYSFFSRKDADLLLQMENMQKIHNEELEKVKKAFEEEKIRHDQNVKKLEEDLRLSKEEYVKAQQEFENKKKINVAKIVKQYGEDPVGLAQKVQSVMGFQIIMPERKL